MLVAALGGFQRRVAKQQQLELDSKKRLKKSNNKLDPRMMENPQSI